MVVCCPTCGGAENVGDRTSGRQRCDACRKTFLIERAPRPTHRVQTGKIRTGATASAIGRRRRAGRRAGSESPRSGAPTVVQRILVVVVLLALGGLYLWSKGSPKRPAATSANGAPELDEATKRQAAAELEEIVHYFERHCNADRSTATTLTAIVVNGFPGKRIGEAMSDLAEVYDADLFSTHKLIQADMQSGELTQYVTALITVHNLSQSAVDTYLKAFSTARGLKAKAKAEGITLEQWAANAARRLR